MISDWRYIDHGGKFQIKQGIYYYKGGTVDILYNIDLSVLTIDSCVGYLREAGYSNGLKLYYKKSGSNNKDYYKLIWNDEFVKEISEDVKTVSIIEIYVDHFVEEKEKNVVDEMDILDNGIESDDPDYEEEQYSDSEEISDEDNIEDDVDVESDINAELEEIRERKRMLKEGMIDPSRESDINAELEEIRERKRMLKEGMIDPSREGNLTDMNVSYGIYNVIEEHGDHRDDDQHMNETRTKRKHDPFMDEMPQWKEFVQHELKRLDTLFSKYDEQTKKRGRFTKVTNEQTPPNNSSQQVSIDNNGDPQASSTQQVIIETIPKNRRGRPPKTSNTSSDKEKVGVLIGNDGHTYHHQ